MCKCQKNDYLYLYSTLRSETELIASTSYNGTWYKAVPSHSKAIRFYDNCKYAYLEWSVSQLDLAS
jgi:hypothetical protein